MKKFAYFVVVVLCVAVGVFAFKQPLMVFVMDKVTADMFVAGDNDNYDPGIAVGEQFPPMLASYQRRQLTGIDEFMGDRGMIFIAVRSADW